MRSILVFFLSAFLLLGPLGLSSAQASAGKAEAEADSNRSIEIQSVPAPIFKDGKLLNYIFLSVKLEMAKGQNVLSDRERVHFVRDALVRNLHKTSIGQADKFDEVDENVALQVVRASAAQIFGDKAVAGVLITSAEPLRQRPHRASPPKPKADLVGADALKR